MDFESKDFMSMSDEDFAYETNLTKEKVEESVVENAIKVLINNGNLYFEDYEGKMSPITYCILAESGDIIFKE